MQSGLMWQKIYYSGLKSWGDVNGSCDRSLLKFSQILVPKKITQSEI